MFANTVFANPRAVKKEEEEKKQEHEENKTEEAEQKPDVEDPYKELKEETDDQKVEKQVSIYLKTLCDFQEINLIPYRRC